MRLRPDTAADGYGIQRGDPILDADLVSGPVGEPGAYELWHITGEIDLPGGRIAYDQRLTRDGGGAYVLEADGAGMRVDATSGRLTLETERDSLARQLVTTYGVPLLLQQHPVLILHACAAIPPNGSGALVVCAASGTGKSTLLVGLVASGWTAVTEDLCVIDLRNEVPLVWPGPPWVRKHGEGPQGSEKRFETADKTAWDIAPWQADGPVPVERLVFLDPAGGDSLVAEPVDRGGSIALLAERTAWLGEPSERGETTFSFCVRVVGAAPAHRVRLPIAKDWPEQAERTLRELLSVD